MLKYRYEVDEALKGKVPMTARAQERIVVDER